MEQTYFQHHPKVSGWFPAFQKLHPDPNLILLDYVYFFILKNSNLNVSLYNGVLISHGSPTINNTTSPTQNWIKH